MTYSTIIISSHNRGKIEEFREMLRDFNLLIKSLYDYTDINTIEETGKTFEENAQIKAQHSFKYSEILSLADDSGLEVDALNGAPGIYSARYAGVGASDEACISKLLASMAHIPDNQRQARFVCSIAIIGKNLNKTFTGICEGTIRHIKSGGNGFGYDPIFQPIGFTKTFAELTSAEKATISHRGKAMNQVTQFLKSIL